MLISASSVGLIILSLGIVALVVTFLINDRRRYLIGLALSGLVIAMGIFQYASSGFKQWQTSRRIAKLQDQQRLNLEALQERLRQTGDNNRPSASAPAPAAESASPAPAQPRPRPKR